MINGKKTTCIFLESDLGANLHKRGASSGPRALKDLIPDSWTTKLTPIQLKPEEVGEDKYSEAHHIPTIFQFQRKAAPIIAQELRNGNFPIVFSGDHSNASATLAGITQAFPNQRTGVIWIDAHADIHTPYTTPSGNMHGMPLAIALAEDNLPCWNRRPEDDIRYFWNKLKGIGGRLPMIHPMEICLFELRDLESEEWAIINRLGIKTVTALERRKLPFEMVVHQLCEWALSFPHLYVSFDIDALDLTLVPGTGTPVAGGLQYEEAKLLLQRLFSLPNLTTLEVTEINPNIEKDKTLHLIHQLLTETLAPYLD